MKKLLLHFTGLITALLALPLTVDALTFDEWRAAHFTAAQLSDPAISGAQADADGDGKVNLIECAFETDPLVPERDGLTVATTQGGYLSLEFPPRSRRWTFRMRRQSRAI